MFGSVPLKTYLPDGDIDLTAFSTGAAAVSEAAVLEVQAALERAEKDADSPFQVTDVQFIQAEVCHSTLYACKEPCCRATRHV